MIKNFVYLAIATCILGSCQNQEEIVKLENSLKKVITENNCNIKLNSSSSTERKLLLTYDCSPSSTLFNGKILLSMHRLLESENIEYNSYEVCDDQNLYCLSIDKNDLKLVYSRMKEFNNTYDLIISKNYDTFYNFLDTEIKTQNNLDSLSIYLDRVLERNYPTFEGFSIETHEDNNFVIFSRSNNNKHFQVVYLLNEPMTVYGFSFE